MQQKIQQQELEMNLHDLNKAVIAALPELPKEIVDEKMKDILSWIGGVGDQYFMLLSNERKDFTIFKVRIKNDNFIKELMEVMTNRGTIKAIDAKPGAFEIWIDDAFYALFPYDLGVIEC